MSISNYDRWLTTPPEDDSRYEAVAEAYPDWFFELHEDEFIGSKEESTLIEQFLYLGLTPKETAEKIVSIKS